MKISRKLVKRILFRSVVTRVIALFALIFIFSAVNLLTNWTKLDDIGYLIDISGKNRMLSQRIAFYAGEVVNQNPEARELLSQSIKSHTENLQIVSNGGIDQDGHDIKGIGNLFKTEIDSITHYWTDYERQLVVILGKDEKQKQQAYAQLVTMVDPMLQANQNLVSAMVLIYETRNRAQNRTLLIILFLSIVTSFLGIIIMVFRVFKPINKMLLFLRTLGGGDLTIEMPIKHKDEMGAVMYAMNIMVARFRDIMTNLENQSHKMDITSNELIQDSQKLNTGASVLATTAEEVSASMSEMTANISQNSQDAAQTSDISQNTVKQINYLKEVATNGFNAIKGISSKIDMINEVSDQTNLLALNAAVEAARAGAHGKGFAVVAKEIRELAEKSKFTSDEIVALSSESLDMVEQTSKALNDSVEKITKSASLLENISVSSIEQKMGVDQINISMQELNQVSQQNDASSNQLSQYAGELKNVSEEIKNIVAIFKVK